MSLGPSRFTLDPRDGSSSCSPASRSRPSGAVVPASADGGEPRPAAKVDFNFQVRPILSDKCFKCHGPDTANRKAGLRLDTKDGAFGETESGARAIVPGNLEESELYRRITAADESERMPPEVAGPDAVARRDRHPQALDRAGRRVASRTGRSWPPVAAPAPEVKRRRLAPQPDRPLRPGPARGRGPRPAARGRQGAADPPRHVRPHRPAPHARRDRRLPGRSRRRTPTSGWSTACWPRRGSASGWPSTGSTWPATPTPTAIRPTSIAPSGRGATGSSSAFNGNLPYDRFVTWQLAGDLLPEPTRDQVLATAFNRHHRQTNEGGSIEEEFRVEYVADRTNTFATAFLGLTLECARCHSHKYDPITQKEYYQLFSFFDSIDESGLYSHFTDAVADADAAPDDARPRPRDRRGRGEDQRRPRPSSSAWRAERGRRRSRPGSSRRTRPRARHRRA